MELLEASQQFLVAQVTPPLFYVGPFQVSRSIDIGTLVGGFVILFGLVKILRSVEKWKDTVTVVLFGETSPDGRTQISHGLVDRVRAIEEECPVLHQHRRKDEETPKLHVRREDWR
jgi:hypothetical protein